MAQQDPAGTLEHASDDDMLQLHHHNVSELAVGTLGACHDGRSAVICDQSRADPRARFSAMGASVTVCTVQPQPRAKTR